ncbi:hypothetical protein ABH930_000420 [Kitasatospora sp. GAS204A]|nr:hypothetical protein [Kitasatospora sp. GAS204B]MDH6117001.1 hypothetical protein [Kitasatospora sp. GAS204B]
MENTMPAAPEEDGGGLLVAVRSIRAARSRADMPSDNTGGKSDQNDT